MPVKDLLIRKPYDARTPVLADLGGPSRTKQSMMAECDINNIMAKYAKTGLIDHVNRYQGRYENVGGVGDYHESMSTVVAAQAAFDSLPAELRARFGNDPGAFLDFVSDPENREAMKQMKLIPPDPPAAKEPPKEPEAPKPAKEPKPSQEPSQGD